MSIEQQYRILDRGRIKAAGVSMDFIFQPYAEFNINPGPKNSMKLINYYHSLRDNPPLPIRLAFFPHDRGEIKKMVRKGPGIYRPILKTDQGAGQFGGFIVGESNNPLRLDIERIEGYAMVEYYLQNQLNSLNGRGQNIKDELCSVQDLFRTNRYSDTAMALERVAIVCQTEGVTFNREADVGRGGVFFIRPMKTESRGLVPSSLSPKITEAIARQLVKFEDLSIRARESFARSHGLIDQFKEDFIPPAYFQADLQITPDYKVIVDQIQLPDVGLFLSELDPNGNETLHSIQQLIRPLRKSIISSLISSIKALSSQNRVSLITRNAVIKNNEDTLEILELQAIAKDLNELGIKAEPVSCDDAIGLSRNFVGVLMNIDPKSAEFQRLLVARLKGQGPTIIPDPFLKLAEHELTDYFQTELNSKARSNLGSLLGEVDKEPNRSYRQILAVNSYLSSLGIQESVLHFYSLKHATPAAVIRGDIEGLNQIVKIFSEADQSITIREIPISPERAMLHDQTGGIYSVLRFTATKI